MTDTDFATDLRAMLRSRAQDVTELPAGLAALADTLADAEEDGTAATPGAAPHAVVDLVPRHVARRHWLPLAAAAAVVALLTGVLVAVLVPSHGGRSTPPVAPPTSTPTHAHALPPVDRRSCRTTFPPAWGEAAGAGTVEVPRGRGGSYPVAVTSDGGVIWIETSDVASDTTVYLSYVAPGSKRQAPLGSMTAPLNGAGSAGAAIDVDGRTAVVSVQQGNHSTFTTKIVAIDLDTRHMTTVADVSDFPGARITSQAYVLDGEIYFQTQQKGSTGSTDRVWAYDVARRTTTKVAGPRPLDLGKSAAGVVWNLSGRALDRPATMPQVVASHVTTNNALFFAGDGTSWAWVTPKGDLEWYGGSGRIVRVPGLLSRPFSMSTPGVPLAVAGPYVQYQVPHTGQDRLIDVRTGATVAAGVQLWGASGTLIGDPLDVHTLGNLMRVDTATLPELTC